MGLEMGFCLGFGLGWATSIDIDAFGGLRCQVIRLTRQPVTMVTAVR